MKLKFLVALALAAAATCLGQAVGGNGVPGAASGGTGVYPNSTTATAAFANLSGCATMGYVFTPQSGTCVPQSGGAVFPGTNGVVYNTSTTASRNATESDLLPIVPGTPIGQYSGSVTYKLGDFAWDASGNYYQSLVSSNTGNALPILPTAATSFWRFVSPNAGVVAGGTCTNQAVTALSTAGAPTCTSLTTAYLTGLGTGVATWLNTPSSANLAAAITDETGTGAAVFAGSPALTGTPTAPTQAVTTNNTDIATTAAVTTALASYTATPAFPSTPQCYFNFGAGSGTSYPATIGSFNFVSSGVVWKNGGGYLSNGNYALIGQCLNNAQTVLVFYQSDVGANIVANAFSTLLYIDSNYYLAAPANAPMQAPSWGTGGQLTAQGTDVVAGPAEVTLNTNGNSGIGVYGRYPVSQWNSGTISTITSSTNSYVSSPSDPWIGTIYAIAAFSTSLTAAQQLAAYNKVAYDMATYGIQFTRPSIQSLLISDGDSISQGYGGVFTYKSTSLNQALASLGVDPTYVNTSHEGYTSAQLLSEYAAKNFPLFQQANFQSRMYSLAIGTNDIFGSVSNATIVSNISSLCADAVAQSAQCIVHTVLPASRNSGGQNTNRNSLNATLTADVLANSINSKILSDWAAEPTMGNVNNDGNATYYVDNVHPTAVGASLLAQADALALHRALSPQTPYWFNVPFTYLAFTGTAALTQTSTTLQLMPGEQVCAAKAQVTTPFSGTLVTALHMTLGDSGGSSTQYLASLSLLATGSTTMTTASTPAYVSASGVVQANFTAIGANLSALTAGNVNVEVEICGNIP